MFRVEIGHFAVMVAEKNTRVGCGMSTYKTSTGMLGYLFACNYARTNRLGCPVYESGVAGSGCKAGNDTVFTSLCKSTELYDPNSC